MLIHCPTKNRNVSVSVCLSVTFAETPHISALREPIHLILFLPARSRNFGIFCQNRFSILVPRRPWERSQGLLYGPVRFPVPAKRFANFVTALSLLLRAPEPSWRWGATIGAGFAAFWVMPGPPPNTRCVGSTRSGRRLPLERETVHTVVRSHLG